MNAARFWPRSGWRSACSSCGASATALLTTLYGLADSTFIPIVGFSVSFCRHFGGHRLYLFTEFALRPVAAQALEAGRAPRRLAPGIMGRTLTVWLLEFRRAGSRHRADRVLRVDAGESERDPVRGGGADHCDGDADLRIRLDVDPVLADGDAGAGGARGAQACRTGRSARRSGGLRRHRARRAAAWLQLDGRRLARARTSARPVRPSRRTRSRRRRRAGTTTTRRRRTPCRSGFRRYCRLDAIGDAAGPPQKSCSCSTASSR